jgi:hypothetical protein
MAPIGMFANDETVEEFIEEGHTSPTHLPECEYRLSTPCCIVEAIKPMKKQCTKT